MTERVLIASSQSAGLKIVAYPGDGMVLLAISLDEALLAKNGGLAGFAVERKLPGGAFTALPNRLKFNDTVTRDTAAETRKWYPSTAAPYQKFRWVDVPPDGFTGTIDYRVTARFFKDNASTALLDGPAATVSVEPVDRAGAKFSIAFTKGYLSSQAYADKFGNKDIRPSGPRSIDFSTAPYLAQYQWLGGEARKAVFDFLDDCLKDKSAKVDVFAYDLDEPDIIDGICRLGQEGRLRAVLDDAALHTKPSNGQAPPELAAHAKIIAAAGAGNVVLGHFSRYAHDKIFVKRDSSGTAQKLLTGSANFSIRGLYVQANNVMVIEDAGTAALYGNAFDVAFAGKAKLGPFAGNAISTRWYDPSGAGTNGLPKFSVSFAPHKNPEISLAPVAAHIRAADSSVLFAIMDISAGGGPVLDDLRLIAADPTIFSYGTVQTGSKLQLQKPEGAMAEVASFNFLAQNVPQPFRKEFNGGQGQVIHHKFVVVDFNGTAPIVYAGSSNLAQGGEASNGDNLLAIADPGIAVMYAVEAVRLFDHYHFRTAMRGATKAAPLTLQGPGAAKPWWQAYYDKADIKLRDRCLFAQVPLPAGVATKKNAAWPAELQSKGAPQPAAKTASKGNRAKGSNGKAVAKTTTARRKSAIRKTKTSKPRVRPAAKRMKGRR